MARRSLLVACCFLSVPGVADELRTSPLAEAFGAYPAMWNVRLSPNGTKISHIETDADGATMLTVIDFAAGKRRAVMKSKVGETVIEECGWANDSRLVCGIRQVVNGDRLNRRPYVPATWYGGAYYTSLEPFGYLPPLGYQPVSTTLLVAVNDDGSGQKELVALPRQLTSPPTLPIVDWLVHEPARILVRLDPVFRLQRSSSLQTATPLAALDVYTGETALIEDADLFAQEWIVDSNGVPRVNRMYREAVDIAYWFVRETPRSEWEVLHRNTEANWRDGFRPLGFASNRNELLYADWHEGRLALFALELENQWAHRVVFEHPTMDIETAGVISPARRLAYVTYQHGFKQHILDEHTAGAKESIQTVFPNAELFIVDEDAERRHYVALVRTPTDGGAFYYYDLENGGTSHIADVFPSLADRTLAIAQTVSYRADDGIEIPGYLVTPDDASTGRAVVLPIEGIGTEDNPGYDLLAQFLAAHGYVVLRSAHRGAEGYGLDWFGDGIVEQRDRAAADLASGAAWLAEMGLADAKRVCVVGWGPGGYLAYVAAVEHPDRFRCAVAISGLTFPLAASSSTVMKWRMDEPLNTLPQRQRVMPRRHARELSVPLFLAYGENEFIAPDRFARDIETLMRRYDKSYESTSYLDAMPFGDLQPYRIDTLARLAEFLEDHLR